MRKLAMMGAYSAFLVTMTLAGPANAGCVVGVSPGSDLLVRSGPSEADSVLGSIPADACGVRVSERCRQNWCEIAFGRVTGWASMKFLDRDRDAPLKGATRVAPSQYRTAEWEFLGARSIDFHTDRDIVPVGRREGLFRAIQLLAKGSAIRVADLDVVYTNGAIDNIPIDVVIRAGGYSRVIDLKGSDRAIKEIRLSYSAPPGSRDRAEVQIFGLERSAPKWTATTRKTSSEPKEWTLLGSRSVTYRTDLDIIPVGRREGRFRAIQLLVTNSAVAFGDLQVVYGNGVVHDVHIRKEIPAGGRTRVIDLKGDARVIKEIRFIYSSDGPRLKAGSVAVYGLRILG